MACKTRNRQPSEPAKKGKALLGIDQSDRWIGRCVHGVEAYILQRGDLREDGMSMRYGVSHPEPRVDSICSHGRRPCDHPAATPAALNPRPAGSRIEASSDHQVSNVLRVGRRKRTHLLLDVSRQRCICRRRNGSARRRSTELQGRGS